MPIKNQLSKKIGDQTNVSTIGFPVKKLKQTLKVAVANNPVQDTNNEQEVVLSGGAPTPAGT